MKEVLEFLSANAPFYIATIEGDMPRVRPFAFVMEYKGKLWFCTNNKKKVYRQLKANPYFEISTTSPENRWIRLTGKAVFDSSTEVKARALESSTRLAKMYAVDDPIFEVFYIEEGEAVFNSMTGESKTIKL